MRIKKICSIFVVFILISSLPLSLAGDEQGAINTTVEYIDFYDLGVIDIFCDSTGLNVEILNNPQKLVYSISLIFTSLYAPLNYVYANIF